MHSLLITLLTKVPAVLSSETGRVNPEAIIFNGKKLQSVGVPGVSECGKVEVVDLNRGESLMVCELP